ncbi:MAG: hypothetical protein H6700_02670 [Myxococcales bacterium]|nr:hypothetical protein [Myxococcales bacterium]
MDAERIREALEKWGAALLVVFAVAWGLMYRGISGETLADALKDVSGALVPVFAAFFAARLVRTDLAPGQRFLRAGEDAVRTVQSAYPSQLQGPKYDRQGYNPEAGAKGGRYLFHQASTGRRRASFVPVSPLSEGVVAITVSKLNLVILGRDGTPEDDARRAVKDAVLRELERLGRDALPHEVIDDVKGRTAIAVDFDEEAMGARRFRRAAERVMAAAHQAVLALPEGPADANSAPPDAGSR